MTRRNLNVFVRKVPEAVNPCIGIIGLFQVAEMVFTGYLIKDDPAMRTVGLKCLYP